MIAALVPSLVSSAAPSLVRADPDPNKVSPGILGFLAFFLLAVALVFLVRSMNGHLRKVRYRQEALEAEQAKTPPKATEPGAVRENRPTGLPPTPGD